jgi:tellurite methyltransferase
VAPRKKFTAIEGQALYRHMAEGKAMVLLDVRTPAEFTHRHIPGSRLVPLQNLEDRIAEIPNGHTPIAVISEIGKRSTSACHLLAEHGRERMMNLDGGLKEWPGPVTAGETDTTHHALGISPSSFLVENFHLLSPGLALDLAMGEGRNAIYLAARGFDVDGVDTNPDAVAHARAAARKLGTPLRAIIGNLEDGTYIIPIDTYNLIIAFNYLHRPLFKEIRDGLLPGGVVVFQTFTSEQVNFGRPKNPDYLLETGELKDVFHDYEILQYRELIGPSRDSTKLRAIAGIVARKPA